MEQHQPILGANDGGATDRPEFGLLSAVEDHCRAGSFGHSFVHLRSAQPAPRPAPRPHLHLLVCFRSAGADAVAGLLVSLFILCVPTVFANSAEWHVASVAPAHAEEILGDSSLGGVHSAGVWTGLPPSGTSGPRRSCVVSARCWLSTHPLLRSSREWCLYLCYSQC